MSLFSCKKIQVLKKTFFRKKILSIYLAKIYLTTYLATCLAKIYLPTYLATSLATIFKNLSGNFS